MLALGEALALSLEHVLRVCRYRPHVQPGAQPHTRKRIFFHFHFDCPGTALFHNHCTVDVVISLYAAPLL